MGSAAQPTRPRPQFPGGIGAAQLIVRMATNPGRGAGRTGICCERARATCHETQLLRPHQSGPVARGASHPSQAPQARFPAPWYLLWSTARLAPLVRDVPTVRAVLVWPVGRCRVLRVSQCNAHRSRQMPCSRARKRVKPRACCTLRRLLRWEDTSGRTRDRKAKG